MIEYIHICRKANQRTWSFQTLTWFLGSLSSGDNHTRNISSCEDDTDGHPFSDLIEGKYTCAKENFWAGLIGQFYSVTSTEVDIFKYHSHENIST